MILQEELDALRALAAKALRHTPGLRAVAPNGGTVWNHSAPLYKTVHNPDECPYELAFAAAAQNALLPLLDELEALRAGGGDTGGHEPPPVPPRRSPVKKKKP